MKQDEARSTSLESDQREVLGINPQALEIEQDRLARFAQRSVLLGIFANAGFVAMIVLPLGSDWIAGFGGFIPDRVWRIVYPAMGSCVALVSVIGWIYGGLGYSPRNAVNRSLAAVGICLSGLAFLVVLIALAPVLLLRW